MPRKRVFITGAGAVSAVGVGADALWNAARDGHSGVNTLKFERWDGNRVTIAAQVKDFDPQKYLDKNILTYCEPFAQFALVAADEAIAQAGLTGSVPLGPRTGVFIGTGIGGTATIEAATYSLYVEKARLDALSIPKGMPNSATSQVSIRFGCTGPSFAVCSACSSATQAIGMAAMMIRAGIIDRAIAGGSEANIQPVAFRHWEALRVLTPDANRPFSKGRNGMVLGEGAGVVVLESEDAASARGAPVLAELLGYGTTTDASDMLRPDIIGVTTAIRDAIADAGIDMGTIDYVNAHGTGTAMNDVVESQAINAVFGAHARDIAVSSTKPIHGHALGAAGGLELIATIMALRAQIAPPTINWLERDENCDVDAVPNQARPMKIRAAMCNSFAFGGINAVLIVGNPG